MSRVEEALRKAQANAQVTSGLTIEPAAVEGGELDTEALAREPFPLEMPERRQPSSRKIAAVSTISAVAPAAKSEPRREVQRPEPLLERIDHTLVEKVVVDRNIAPASRE